MAIRGNVKQDLCGKRFGRLLVTDVYKQKRRKDGKSKRTHWLCKCDCGNEKWAERSNLLCGYVSSCGCYRLEVKRIEYGRAAANRVFRTYKYGANKRNLNFDLNFDDFFNLTQKNCFYCGKKPSTIQLEEGGNGNFIYNGIDRVNNDLGYTLSNCVTCCVFCNHVKGKNTQETFIDWIKKTYNHLDSKGFFI